MTQLSPVLIIGYRRYGALKEVLSAVPKDGRSVYLYVGNAKSDDVTIDVEICKKICKGFAEDYSNTKLFFAQNESSMESGIVSAIDWIFSNENSAIILEDDIVPTIEFFYFCDDALDYFVEDFRIWQISGFMPAPVSENVDRVFLGVTPTTWGWATWKSRWSGFSLDFSEYRLRDFREFPIIRGNDFNQTWVNYWNQIFELCKAGVTHWDYQWYYHAWLNEGYALFPNKQLVRNIGIGGDATHTFGAVNQSWLVPPKIGNFRVEERAFATVSFDRHMQKALDFHLNRLINYKDVSLWLSFDFFISEFLRALMAFKVHKLISRKKRKQLIHLLRL